MHMSKMLMGLDDGWLPSWLAYGGKYHCKTLNENRTWVWQTEEGAKEEGGRRVPVFPSAGRLQGSRSGCGLWILQTRVSRVAFRSPGSLEAGSRTLRRQCVYRMPPAASWEGGWGEERGGAVWWSAEQSQTPCLKPWERVLGGLLSPSPSSVAGRNF